jgi:hypothetical protein
MIIGDIRRVNLGTRSFKKLITDGALYVDKTQFIEHVLNNPNEVLLITRHRRLGKTLNMDMLRVFLTDEEDHRDLFKGLYIENSPVWSQANSFPVFYYNFKGLNPLSYKKDLHKETVKHMRRYLDIDHLHAYDREIYDDYLQDGGDNWNGLYILTELVYNATGKQSIILIDEYDNLLTREYRSENYLDIRNYLTQFLSVGLKDNSDYLYKGVVTGVMRISYESFASGFNNGITYDIFNDKVFMDDYGLTDDEMGELATYMKKTEQTVLDLDRASQWYDGIRIGSSAIYNLYSVMNMLIYNEYNCYWGNSGTMDIIVDLMNEERRRVVEKLINKEPVQVSVSDKISLKHLATKNVDSSFYSLLVQAGYITLEDKNLNGLATVSIPNRELMTVWKNFQSEVGTI